MNEQDQKDLISAVAHFLKKQRRNYYISTKAVLKYLRNKKRFANLDEVILLQVLLDDTSAERSPIHKSLYPRGDGFDYWWGHADRIWKDRVPYIPDRDELRKFLSQQEGSRLSDLGWSFFVSYNYKDIKKILRIRSELVRRGYGAWIAHVENKEENEAIAFVGQFLPRLDFYLLYLSRNSLSSRWVHQEFQIATTRNQKPILVVFDGTDGPLLDLIALSMEHEEQNDPAVMKLMEALFPESKTSITRIKQNLQPFLQAIKELLSEVAATTVYPMPAKIEQGIVTLLKIRTLDEALAALHDA